MQNQMRIVGALRLLSNRYSCSLTSTAQLSSKPKVTITDDGQTIVCLHPQEKHPYEHTLPYVDSKQVDSVFKPAYQSRGENMYTDRKPASVEELQALTFTPKHVWKRRRFDGLQMRPKHPRQGV